MILAAVDGRTPVTDRGFRTALRRADHDPEGVRLAREDPIRLGPLTIEPALRRLAHDDGREAILEPRVMQVLVALAKADGRILPRDELIASCWAGVVVSEDALNRVMSRLRRLADGFGVFAIETITKVGYRLTITALDAGVTAAAAHERAEVRGPSICVLPFVNMSDDRQQDYFSDGITEDIITDLSKVASLFVTARTTAFTYRDKGLGATEVASELEVGHVLEGSVRKAGGRVRITAQLVDGATGGHVWAERYDRDLGDIFAVQDEISDAVVAALKLKLAPEEKRAIERRGTADPKAYDLYLMARRYFVPGREGDRAGLETIARLATRATEIDPNYAEAWTLLAQAQSSLRTCFNTAHDGHAAVDRALALNPGLAEAHAIKAGHLIVELRFDEAQAEVEVALAADPDSWIAHSTAGRLYYSQGRIQEAVHHLEIAVRAGRAAEGTALLISGYRALGDWEGVRRAARLAASRAELALQQDCVNSVALSCSVMALAALGEVDRAMDMIERALLLDPTHDILRYNLACDVAAFLNDPDKAFALLTPVFETMPPYLLAHAKVDPDLDSIRDDPRFVALVAAAEARLAAPGALMT